MTESVDMVPSVVVRVGDREVLTQRSRLRCAEVELVLGCSYTRLCTLSREGSLPGQNVAQGLSFDPQAVADFTQRSVGRGEREPLALFVLEAMLDGTLGFDLSQVSNHRKTPLIEFVPKIVATRQELRRNPSTDVAFGATTGSTETKAFS